MAGDGQHEVVLPIRSYAPQIIQAVKEHPVTVVIGETGSGKTTQISQVSCSCSCYALRVSSGTQSLAHLLKPKSGGTTLACAHRRSFKRLDSPQVVKLLSHSPAEWCVWDLLNCHGASTVHGLTGFLVTHTGCCYSRQARSRGEGMVTGL